MQFVSGDFVIFFIFFYLAYILLMSARRLQNALILIASYVFYMWWDWRFGLVLAAMTIQSYIFGLAIHNAKMSSKSYSKFLTGLSIAISLSTLGVFKYFDFFLSNFAGLATLFNVHVSVHTLQIILPIGISFYTFQITSYIVAIQRGDIEPAREILEYSAFVAFFPKLVAGPIERPESLLQQFAEQRKITAVHIDSAIYLILYGFFKKLVIADRLGSGVVDPVFANPASYTGSDYLLAILGFTFQLYCDFSAYSDIARGVARLMGFELTINFRLPYFALNPTDFWNRWHISLSNWIRDHMFLPLSRYLLANFGRKHQTSLRFFATVSTMTMVGLWHGAAWTYVLWGTYHGLLLFLFSIFDKTQIHQDPWNSAYHGVTVIGRMILMFFLVAAGWFLFRAESIGQIAYMISHFTFSRNASTLHLATIVGYSILPLLAVEIWQYVSRDLLAPLNARFPVKAIVLTTMWVAVMFLDVNQSAEFIYFQY